MIRLFFSVICIFLACSNAADPGASSNPPSTPYLEVYFSGDTTGFNTRSDLQRTQDGEVFCEVTASWTQCWDDDFFMYIIYRSDSAGIGQSASVEDVIAGFSSSDSTILADQDVVWSRAYYYAVATFDTENLFSMSNEVSISTPDLSPTSSVLSQDTLYIDRVSLKWTACLDYDFDSYKLYRSISPNIELNPMNATLLKTLTNFEDTTFTDSTVAWGTWFYALRTRDEDGFVSWSNELEVYLEYPDFPWQITQEIESYGSLLSVAIDNVGNWMYSTDTINMRLLRISYPLFKLSFISVPVIPVDICILPDNSKIYVCCNLTGDIMIIDPNTFALSGAIHVDDDPTGICSTPNGEYVYTTGLHSSDIYIISTPTDTVVDSIEVDLGSCGIDCTPDGEYIYVCFRYTDEVRVIRTFDNQIIDSIPVGDAPSLLHVSENSDYVFVCNTLSRNVSVIRTIDNSVIQTIDINGEPSGVIDYPSADILYVSDRTAGRILLYNRSTWQLCHTIDTGSDAREIALSPSGDFIIVAGGNSGNLILLEY